MTDGYLESPVPMFQENLGSEFHFGFETFFFSRGSAEKKGVKTQTELATPPVPGTLERPPRVQVIFGRPLSHPDPFL